MILPGCFRQWLQGFEAGSNLFGFRFFPHLARRIVWTGFKTIFSLIEDTCCNSKGPLQFDDRHPTAVASSISKAWSPMAPISLNQVWLAMQKIGGVSLIHIIFMWRNVSFFHIFGEILRQEEDGTAAPWPKHADWRIEVRTTDKTCGNFSRQQNMGMIHYMLDFLATTPFLDHSVQLQITNTGN